MKPEEMLNKTRNMAKAMDSMLSRSVAVGLPQEEASSAAYDSGATVIDVGAAHEYGAGVPQRSFLRVPFIERREDIGRTIDNQWKRVVDGADADRALGLIGAKAANISQGAFRSGGYGKWPDISDETKEAKGSSMILVNNRILVNAITWVVR